MVADEIDAGDVDVQVVRYMEPMHFPQIVRAAVDHLYGDDAVLQDELVGIDILEEEVEYFEALFDAFLHKCPLIAGDDAGDDIEGEDLFDALAAVVYGEGDALAHKEALGKVFFFVELFDGFIAEVSDNLLVMVANLGICTKHFVPGVWCWGVTAKISRLLH